MDSVINVTENAVNKYREILAGEQNAANKAIRITFGGFGWGGPSLQLTLDELNGKEDIVVESQGVKIAYDESIKRFVSNSVIDYSSNFFYRGFFIRGAGVSSC